MGSTDIVSRFSGAAAVLRRAADSETRAVEHLRRTTYEASAKGWRTETKQKHANHFASIAGEAARDAYRADALLRKLSAARSDEYGNILAKVMDTDIGPQLAALRERTNTLADAIPIILEGKTAKLPYTAGLPGISSEIDGIATRLALQEDALLGVDEIGKIMDDTYVKAVAQLRS